MFDTIAPPLLNNPLFASLSQVKSDTEYGLKCNINYTITSLSHYNKH